MQRALLLPLILLFLSASCQKQEEQDDPVITPAPFLEVKSGWDIYTGGIYRYGPSIMIHDDGTIDAWFATPGGSYLHRVGDVREALQLAGEASAGLRFEAEEPFLGFKVSCPTWGTTTSSIRGRLFRWDTNYATTLAAEPLFEERFENVPDNGLIHIGRSSGKFPAGTYLWVVDAPEGTIGVWKRDRAEEGQQGFLSGDPYSGSFDAFISVTGNEKLHYWDKASWRRSTDGGKTWSEEKMVLYPTQGTEDQLSVCDPGVARWGGYYYLGYTSTENEGGRDNHVYLARSENPDGPWEKWNGTGWGGDPEAAIRYTGDPEAFGAGEPCFVVKDETIYFYYSWNDMGDESCTTRLATADASNPLWPSELEFHGTVINKSAISAADHCDIKYHERHDKFYALHTASRMTAGSYLVVWESENGIDFQQKTNLRDNLKPFLHNCGWSGNELGHMVPGVQQYVSYAYGEGWASWDTHWHPIQFGETD